MDHNSPSKINTPAVRVRIAPSPTGPLHLGTARTALFNFFFARKHGGSFILRIEDTDKERSEKKWEKDIFEGLHWLGVKWDEGPSDTTSNNVLPATASHYGPYRQSERTDIYKRYLEKLLEDGKAFYCWHTKEELEKEKHAQEDAHTASRHLCAFRDTNPKDISQDQKKESIIRIKNDAEIISFHDLIRGEITTDMRLLGDFSIAKNSEEPLYNFAAVVDDFEMQITHVMRGEDHISNTPKQILLQDLMGAPRPFYAHLPLILGTDRSKLSKRHGSTALLEYREMGYLPEALDNFLALLGWSSSKNEEILNQQDIINDFAIERIQASGAIFNLEKLDWMNGMYIRRMTTEELAMHCIPYLVMSGLLGLENPKSQIPNSKFQILNSGEVVNFEWIKRIVALEQERMKKLSEIGEQAKFFFVKMPGYDKELLRWKSMDDGKLSKVLETLTSFIDKIPAEKFDDANMLEEILMPHAEEAGDRGTLLWPLRVALTGQKASPGPFDVMSILGKEKTLARLDYAKGLLE